MREQSQFLETIFQRGRQIGLFSANSFIFGNDNHIHRGLNIGDGL